MVMQPSVLLLDEPLCNLDAKLRGQMRNHIKELQQKTGLTMIYVTHDQSEAMALSDRIIVMNGGVVEQVGSPESVYERPCSEFVADFVGAINFIWGDVVEVKPQHNLLRVSTGGETLACALNDNVCPNVGTRVLLMIRPEKIGVMAAHAPCSNSDFHGLGIINKIKATVKLNTYCGDHRELNVAATDFCVRVIATNTMPVEKGGDVRLEFYAQDLHLLPHWKN
jgi:iron(III) transport system ATP-binding protein